MMLRERVGEKYTNLTFSLLLFQNLVSAPLWLNPTGSQGQGSLLVYSTLPKWV